MLQIEFSRLDLSKDPGCLTENQRADHDQRQYDDEQNDGDRGERAAMFGRWRVDRNSLRYSGANTMAKTVPHKIAPLSGHRIHANASDTATTSSRKLFSSRSRSPLPSLTNKTLRRVRQGCGFF